MTSHTAVRVGDDLAPGESSVTLGTADDETSRRIDVDARVPVEHRTRNHVLDDLVGDFVANDFERNVGFVLG